MKKNGASPAVIRFRAKLAARLEVPKAAAAKLRGMTTLEGTINDHPFRAPLEWDAPGGCTLRVNDAMRRGSRAKIGDAVALAVLGPEPEPAIPPDLRSAFSAFPNAKALWKDLTLLARLDWIRWIDGAKTPETRARRVRRTVEQLEEGKRRPCCVNFYEFMLAKVRK